MLHHWRHLEIGLYVTLKMRQVTDGVGLGGGHGGAGRDCNTFLVL